MGRSFGSSLTIAALSILLLASVAAGPGRPCNIFFNRAVGVANPIDYVSRRRVTIPRASAGPDSEELFGIGSGTKASIQGGLMADRLRTARLRPVKSRPRNSSPA